MSSEAPAFKAVEAAVRMRRRGWAAVKRVATIELLLVGFILGTLIAIFFYDVVFGGRTLITSSFQPGVLAGSPPYGYEWDPPEFNFYLRDPLASATGEPTAHKVARLYRDLQLPLWDANVALGRPLLGGLDPGAVSPIRLPLALSPSPAMWDAFLLARFLVAGIFTYLLARRLGLIMSAALGAAVAYTFSGFFMIFVNMPHVAFAMMIPILLYAFELLLERPAPGRMAFAAAAVAVGILVDNPEAAAVLLLYGAGYYLARSFQRAHSERGFRFWPRLLPLSLALTAGIGLTAFALLPFLELSGSAGFGGFSVHRHTAGSGVGLLADNLRSLISLFVPYFFGPPLLNFQGTGGTGIRNYVGVVVPILALIGIWNRPAMGKAGWFFLGTAVILVAKTYGVPAVHWIGELPVLGVIDFRLYLAPVIGFSLAMLAGSGLDQISRTGFRSWQPVTALVALGSVIGWLVWVNRAILPNIPDSHLASQLAFASGLGLITAAVAVASRRGLVSLRTGTAVLVALIAFQLFTFTLPNKGGLPGEARLASAQADLPVIERPHRYDPFTEPPYITFLKADKSKYRVFGLDYVLYPNSSRVYDIDDIRGFTATTVERYFLYIKNFINPTVKLRFTGAYLPPFRSEGKPPLLADNRLFDLLNVKYIITPRGLPQAYDYELTERLLADQVSDLTLRTDVFTINGDDDIVLFQHPPSSLSYTLTPREESRFLLFRLALDPEAWQPERGDGVQFRVSVREGSKIQMLFSRWVDPKNTPEDRRWIEGMVDLGPYLGRQVDLILTTSPGETDGWDWAGWGSLRLATSPETAADPPSSNQFELVYDGEVRVYEDHDAFPRAFIVHRARPAAGQDAAIALLKQPDFDPATEAVVEGVIPPAELTALAASPIVDESSVEITSYGDNRVELLADLRNPGLLVLSDTYYPGWRAYVDGNQTEIYPTDLALRSVFLPAGEHKVVFVFSPGSFKLGLWVTFASFTLLILYAAWVPVKRAVMSLAARRSKGE